MQFQRASLSPTGLISLYRPIGQIDVQLVKDVSIRDGFEEIDPSNRGTFSDSFGQEGFVRLLRRLFVEGHGERVGEREVACFHADFVELHEKGSLSDWWARQGRKA